MKNKEVVRAFLRKEVARTLNLMSTGDRLISYNTCIAQWVDKGLIINKTKYSTTTSRHRGYIDITPIKTVDNIQINTLYLERV